MRQTLTVPESTYLTRQQENHDAQIKLLNAILARLDRIDESLRAQANHEH